MKVSNISIGEGWEGGQPPSFFICLEIIPEGTIGNFLIALQISLLFWAESVQPP